MELSYLNDKQKEAVLYNDGPLMILAGAGSGKTRVITSKIYYLIEELKVDPYNILAITFTNRAVGEIVDRIGLLLNTYDNRLTASTYHSFCLFVLRRNIDILGFNKNFVVMDNDDSVNLLKSIDKDSGLEDNKYKYKEIYKKISRYKNSNYTNNILNTEELEIFEKYQDKLKENNAVDFDDLLLLTLKLFKDFPDVLKYYQNRFKYILIDEFQDTNYVQYEISYLLAKKHRNITCVGDIDQSIYSFREANYENIFLFEEDFKDLKIIKLEENYRSTGNILDASNSLIKHNENRIEKVLWTKNERGEKIYCYSAYDERDEAAFVLNEIMKLQLKGVNNREIAVFYRNNILAKNIETILLYQNIPYRVFGDISFYDRKEIKDIRAYFRFIYNDKDTVSLKRIINFPKRGIGEQTLARLTEKALVEEKTLYDAIDSGKELIFKNLIEELKESFKDLTLVEMFDLLIEKLKLNEEYGKKDSLELEKRLENINQYRNDFINYGDAKGLNALGEFLLQTSLFFENKDDDFKDRINLMTIHSSKGCEFDYVFIIGLEDTVLPSIKEDSDIEEERRIFYVAMTRARKKVYLVTTINRILYGQLVARGRSRFIDEIDREFMDISFKEEFKKTNIDDMYNEEETVYVVGDNVHHKIFGRGKVVRIIDDKLIEVDFYSKKEKKIINKQHRDLVKY